MFQEQRFWLLVSLKLSGEATVEELAELDNFLAENPGLSKRVEALSDLWKEKNESAAEKKEDAFDKHMQRLSNYLSEPALQYEVKPDEAGEPETKKQKRGPVYRKLWWGSAAAASILFCWIFFSTNMGNRPAHPKHSDNTISTKPGSKTSIVLPDGSKVWLNADSKITYGGNFHGSTREVYLSGEAFFDVAKDVSRPFIIHTQTIDIKVLGTAFNVRSYTNENETETSLVHGSVEVTLKNHDDKKIILKPSEKLTVTNSRTDSVNQRSIDETVEDTPLVVLSKMHFFSKDSSSPETSWTKNRLAFHEENLEEIARKIERWYNVHITIKDTLLNDEKYTGLFEDETLEEVMEALRLTGSFKYTLYKKQVVISR